MATADTDVNSLRPGQHPHRISEFKPPDNVRHQRKERLAAAFRLFAKYGFSEGAAGHISVRDPEHTDHYWANPFGMSFSDIRVSDLVLVDPTGSVMHEDWRVNESATVIHSAIYRTRPDVASVAHAHSLHGSAFSALHRTLQPITQDACAFYEDHILYDDYTGVVLDAGEGQRIAATLGPHKAAILQNHGLMTVGRSVDEAAWWFILMERVCQTELLAAAAGDPVPIAHEVASRASKQVGTAGSGWFNFQPLFNMIIKEQPDLLE